MSASITRCAFGWNTPGGYVDDRAIEPMREWLIDCEWGDVEPCEIAEFNARTILKAVHRHYDGGIEGFLSSL